MSNGDDQSQDSDALSQIIAGRAQPAKPPGPTLAPRATPVSPPPPAPGPDPTQFGALANARGGFVQELSDNPDLRRRFMAMANQEVGSDNDATKQAFIESVMNRAVSRRQSLSTALHSIKIPGTDKGYFDPKTGAHADDPVSQDDQDSWNPMINRALSGSNVSGFSTGNQNPDPHLKQLPVNFDPQTGTGNKRDTFVIEEQDKDWADGMIQQQAQWNKYGQPTTPGALRPGVAPRVNVLKDVRAPRALPVDHPTTQTDSDDTTDYAGPSLGGSLGAVNV